MSTSLCRQSPLTARGELSSHTPLQQPIPPQGHRSEEVRVIYPGPSQAPDKVLVFFPSRGLLHGGCMIFSGSQVGKIADADLASWPRAVRAVAELPASVVIPGHGARLDPSLIQNTLDVLARAKDRATAER